MLITRCSSTDSATATTAHVFSSRTRVSPTSGTRSVTAYSQAPDGKRMVIDSEATGLLPPLDLARCQVGTARGRAVGSDLRVADFVLFETLCSGADRPKLLERIGHLSRNGWLAVSSASGGRSVTFGPEAMREAREAGISTAMAAYVTLEVVRGRDRREGRRADVYPFE